MCNKLLTISVLFFGFALLGEAYLKGFILASYFGLVIFPVIISGFILGDRFGFVEVLS